MRNAYVILVFMLYALPALAVLNVNATSMAPAYANSNASVTMLNLTLNTTANYVNVTALNVSTASTGNVSYVELVNESGVVIGTGTTFAGNSTLITLGSAFSISPQSSRSIVVVFGVHADATPLAQMPANITSNESIAATDPVYIHGGAGVNSSLSQIQDLHAAVRVTPRFVDTSVPNQSFIYNLTPSGTDAVASINITLPSTYTNVQLLQVRRGDNVLVPGTDYSNATGGTTINITLVSPTTLPLLINFTANTSAAANTHMVNASIDGGNLSAVLSDVTGTNTTVSTQQIISVSSVRAVKNTAYMNGTDYWEFEFNLNFTASTNGSLQFRLDNWTSLEGSSIMVANGTVFHASLRNASSIINVTSSYNSSLAMPGCCAQGTIYSVALRMLLPSSVTTVSSSWWTTYAMLFRSQP